MFDFNGKNILIVGGTSGIGYAMGVAFARSGANVVATSKNPTKVAEAAQALQSSIAVACDATQAASVQNLMDTLRQHWDGLDVLVNCQGIHHKVPSQDVSDEQFASLIDVNLTSVFRVCREAFPMLKQTQGNIINVASMATFLGLKHAAAYSASKGGIGQLTKTLAVDWAEFGIRVNAIAPGWILTALSQPILAQPEYRDPIIKRIPLARFGQPEEVANAALFLASDYARYITGTILTVDGGVLASV